ncbi:MAG: fumarylacetoacetate hydrolase family protein [Thermoleophilia bacterium]|nr:fumarylacetoacetate hydrolase family protein [Thermoleophilia bacterium]
MSAAGASPDDPSFTMPPDSPDDPSVTTPPDVSTSPPDGASGTTPPDVPSSPPDGAFGRLAVGMQAHHCRFAGGAAVLLDRPAWDLDAAELGAADLGGARLLAPAVPGKVVAVGLNYAAHAAEFDSETAAEPILFLKPRTSLIGPGDAIVLPARSTRVDYEAELALVIGRRCHDVSAAEAAGCVAGYTCANDITARDLQALDGQWTRSKGFDTFCPLGPWVVPDPPPPEARVVARLDGRVVQEGLVGDMLVSPLELVAFVSGVMTLEPGDVVLTGTPPGVGPLATGQTVTVEIGGVGRLVSLVRG